MSARGARILAVDDEVPILRVLRANLGGEGYEVETVSSGREALEAFRHRRPDLVLLDLGLPDLHGSAIIREIRAASATPIIVLSVTEDERAKVEALDAGADDYLTKPFGVRELLARVRVALRHAAGPRAGTEPVFRAGDLAVDFDRRRVTRGGEEVRLTPTEYELLKVFIQSPDRVLTHRALLNRVWGPAYTEEGHYLHVYIANLRRKIESDPRHPRHLITEPGTGYRFRTAPDS